MDGVTRHARERIRGMRIAVSTNTRPDIALTIDLVPRIGQDNRRRRRETARNRGSRYRETSFVCARFDVARCIEKFGEIADYIRK